MTPPTGPPHPLHDWQQVSLWCADPSAAEQMAVRDLGPRLTAAEGAGLLAGWWFLRKGACWRIRYQPHPGHDTQAHTAIGDIMRDLAATGQVDRWTIGVYEPESHAFGGRDGMDTAHRLFHADSGHLLDHLRSAGDRYRTEAGLLLACALMRGAAQDIYEQGDVLARVAAHRPTPRPPTDTETAGAHLLLTARGTTLDWAPAWPAAFRDAGVTLADLARTGRLTRGLRAVLAHHVLFTWNRAGIGAHRQALLAGAAVHAVFHTDHHLPRPAPGATITRLG